MSDLPRKRPDDRIMTVKEVAEYLRVHPTTVYRLLRQGKLPAFRIGSDWRFRQADLVAWSRDQGGKEAEAAFARRHPRSVGAPARATQ